MPARPEAAIWDRPAVLAAVGRGLLAVLCAVAGAGLGLRLVGPLVAGTPPVVGALATARTVVLSSAVLGLAVASRSPRTAEFGWLVYPALAFGALGIVLQDLWLSSPSTLFVALAAYGTALVVGPKLARETRRQARR